MKAITLIIPLILTSCAYTHEPDVAKEVRGTQQYTIDLEQCQDQAQPSLEESLVRGISPIAGGTVYGSDSVQLRVDDCLRARGYEVETNWLWRNI